MEALFGSPFRPINDTVYEITTVIHRIAPWMDGSAFSSVFLPLVWAEADTSAVQPGIYQGLCVEVKGNSALGELFLIIGGSGCVASSAVGSEGMEHVGVRKQRMERLWWQQDV